MKVFLLFPFLWPGFLTTFLATTIVHAEYRVFVLKISKPNPEEGQPALSRTIQSSLDPVQYRDLYPVSSDEQVEYIDTWRCFGRTGDFQDYCPKPDSGAKTEGTALTPKPEA